MKKSILFLVIFSLFFANGVFAQRGSSSQGDILEVRLASFMPKNSDWGRTLDRMAAEWWRVTDHRVRLVVIHDGLEGGEEKMLTSMSAGNIHAGVYTSFGLNSICPSVVTLSTPFLIRSEEELDLVLKEARPLLDAQVNKTPFVVISWSKGGWVNIFSKEPVLSPDDLRRMKVAINPEIPKLNAAFKAMGFNVLETDITDVGTKIANNSINAFYQSPAAVAPLGLHRYVSNMMETILAPFMGSIVMNRVTWNRISPSDQAKILQVSQKITEEFEAIMPRTAANAIVQMQKGGLKVNKLTPAQEQLWQAEVQKVMPSLLGNNTFDPELYNKINEILRKSRSGQ